MATERILVHSSIATEFQNVLAKTVNAMFGSQEDTPVLITSAAAKKNRALVEDAISQGAKPLDMFTTELDANTVDTKMRPVVLTNMSTSMDLYRQESFGPSVSWFAFDTEEEAIKLANDTDYGLSASIYTENLGTAFRVAEQLDSGAVHINSMTVHDEFALPHGGVKKRKLGECSMFGTDLDLYCCQVPKLPVLGCDGLKEGYPTSLFLRPTSSVPNGNPLASPSSRKTKRVPEQGSPSFLSAPLVSDIVPVLDP
uniref:Aldehyde dehydrogenase domain-containing protein n=1 Tax=Fusarium oxysporum (strain Fo5176) TaxID=660025 RepID=A0A0D2XFD6_FUSOF